MTFIDPTLKRFFAYVKPYRTWIIAAAIAAILKFGIPLAFPLVVKEVINLLVAPPPFEMLYLHEMMGSMLAVYVVWTGISYLRSYFADLVSQRMIFDLRQEFFQHVQTLSLGFFERRQVGTVASRLLSDVAIAQNFVSAASINTVMDLLSKGPKEIVLRDVSFEYEGAAPVLQDVTLTIPDGSVTALVGKSGALPLVPNPVS